MSCLLKFNWVKLPRETLPQGKGVMGSWARLAARAAFRPGQTDYCGHRNDVELASWVGGIVGLKSILGVNSRQKAMGAMDALTELGYISYTFDKATKKLSYTIKDWVVECSGVACADGAVYATDGYGFLCLPRNITQRLAELQHKFEESDAWLDLWCHTVWQDFRNAFSCGLSNRPGDGLSQIRLSGSAPIIQFGYDGAALTLEKLGARWGWEKTKVWRFLQKHGDVFPLRKLPGSYGCLVFNAQYPGAGSTVPVDGEIARLLDRIRFLGQNTRFGGSDNQKLNRMIAAYSKRVISQNRVALPIYAYISLRVNCKHYDMDCKEYNIYGQLRSTGAPAPGSIERLPHAAAAARHSGRR